MKEKDVLTVDSKREKHFPKSVVIGLSVAVGVLGLSTIGLGIAYGCMASTTNDYAIQLENVYQKNLYDLVESVNNTETKLSKILVSNSSTYQKKLLAEIAQNSELAENSIASLPISQNSLADSVKFINQMGGYTQTLTDQISQGKNLSSQDLNTLSKLQQSVNDMKAQINKFVKKVQQNYSILDQSFNLDGDFNNFTIEISKIKGEGVDYPVMIYDGPFADSTLDKTVKGLKGDTLTEQECQKEVEKCFKNCAEISYSGEINSRFETYTYHVTNSDSQVLFVQVSKVGGHVITVSGQGSTSGEKNITEEDAKNIALDFAKQNGVENPQIVWIESVNNHIYLNIAPTENDIILYPDLVKVKVDMASGTVIGYDATNYFINHIPRALKKTGHNANEFKSNLPKDMTVKNQRLVLAPLDYNREVICFEYECEKEGATYYFYLNAENGEEENVLKVIQTDDSSKLM